MQFRHHKNGVILSQVLLFGLLEFNVSLSQ